MRYIFLQCQESSRNVHELSYFSACYLCDPFEGTPPPCFVFSLCSFIFTILHYFSSFLCEPSKCFSTWWMNAQTSILSFSQMSVLCTNFLSPERSAFMFCWDGCLQWVWWKNCSTGKWIYIRKFLCQFDMSNFSLTSIKITVGINRTITYLMIVFFFSLQNRIHEN